MIIYGILFGLIYALVSAGFTLVFGVSKILNLSYGALYMTTAYMVYYFSVLSHVPLLLSVFLAIVVTIAMGLAIFYFVLKFTKNPMIFMVTMLLFALLLQYLYSYFFGGEIGFTIPGLFSNTSVLIENVSIPTSLIISSLISIILIISVWLWIEKSSFGRKVRATSEDPEIAELLGINTKNIILIVLTISIIFIALASVLIVPSEEVTPDMWINPFVIAFAVSIIGGLGKFQWIIPSAFIVSFAEVITQYLIPYNISNIMAFIIVIIFIIIFPNGLGGIKHET
ncbi:MAG: branched-chain amino acid ABC transporter permease [Candidatus Micrarchaeia archaeon]